MTTNEINANKFNVGMRVRVYLVGGNYCNGWVEDRRSGLVGVRLVNGNFKWCKPGDVKAERPLGIDPYNGEGLP